MADIYKQMTDVRANLVKNAFDLSERHLFTAKCGQLLPIYNKQVVPGDYFEIDPISFLRTMPLNTANFARMRQHIDVFFVPYCQLWHPFPEMKYQRADETSTVYHQGLMSPYMTLYDLYSNVLCAQSKQDRFGFSETFNRIRLCDLLGYGSLRNCVNMSGSDVLTPDVSFKDSHVTIWPWLAYQKIWYDWYRNPYWDVTQATASFNIDDVNTSAAGDSNIVTSRFGANASGYQVGLDGIFSLRYRQWKKDYFTGTFPERQFGGISMISPSGLFRNAATMLNNTTPTTVNTGTSNGELFVSSAGSSDSYLKRSNWTLEDSISALDVRRMELLQIWKEKTMRAGYRTEAQQMAHFGVRSKYIPDNHVQYLGGISDVVNISEVVSTSIYDTSATGNTGLGQLGGKGTSLANGQKIKFHASDDGVLMVMYSILPESEYNAFGLAKEHTRIDPFDYFTPAFQNLGFETVGEEQGFSAALPQNIVGYAPPYYDMKMGIDKAHGEFITAVSRIQGTGSSLNNKIGSLSMFDTARRDTNYRNINFYYVDPHVTDSIFLQAAESHDTSDPFYINCYLSIKAVRPMSVLGLPNF